MGTLDFILVQSDNEFEEFIKLYKKWQESSMKGSDVEKFKQDIFQDNAIITILLAQHNKISIWFTILIDSYSTTLLSKTYYLEEFFIDVDYRRQWYWKKIFCYLQEFSKKNNRARIEWSTHENNTAARNFYQGFGVEEDWIFYKMNFK